MDKRYIIAADIGTTSTKTLVIDTGSGAVAASHSIEYPLHTPAADRAEQDPNELFQAVVNGIRAVVDKAGLAPGQIMCVSFSSAMHSLIAVDRQGEPLTPCITWADNRSLPYAEKLKREMDGHSIYLDTGTPIHPMSPLPKLMWLREQEPEMFRQAFKFISIKEYVFAKLFGRYVVDHSIASATGLLNLRRLNWDERAMQAAGISPEQLSEPVDATFRLEGLHGDYASRMGLLPDTPFIVGASDGVLANLGVGASEPGVLAVTIGTSGAVRGVFNEPVTDPQGRLFCYALNKNYWVVGGAINNGGIMLRWVRDQLATLEAQEGRARGLDPYDYLTEIAQSVAPGSDGLIFLPLLAGERAPYWNANARGVFFGLSLYHQKKHMIRSVMEGVVYRIHSVASALEELTGPAKEIRASGGFARSGLWRQMMADVLGTPVTVPTSIESSGLGAAVLGLMAMNETADLGKINEWVHTINRHDPDEKVQPVYRTLTDIYANVYQQLRGPFDEIAAFQKEHAKISNSM